MKVMIKTSELGLETLSDILAQSEILKQHGYSGASMPTEAIHPTYGLIQLIQIGDIRLLIYKE